MNIRTPNSYKTVYSTASRSKYQQTPYKIKTMLQTSIYTKRFIKNTLTQKVAIKDHVCEGGVEEWSYLRDII